MNERIETLAKAAGYDMINKAAMRALGFDVEKFAELIVRECMSNLYLHGYDDAAKCLQDIHFGIEDPV
jgi:hypothetical protein